jgi:hypothetical protein
MRSIYFFILCLIFFNSYSQNQKQLKLDGVWLGSYYNENAKYALPSMLDFNQENVIIYRAFNKLDTAKFSLVDSILFIDSTKYEILELSQDKLYIRPFGDSTIYRTKLYRKIKGEKIDLSLKQIKTLFQQHNFTNYIIYPFEHIKNKDNNLEIQHAYYIGKKLLANEKESYKYEVIQYKSYFFLAKRNETDSISKYPLEQLISINNHEFTTLCYNALTENNYRSSNVKYTNYKLIDQLPFLPIAKFNVCNEDHLFQYYHHANNFSALATETQYDKGFNFLNQYFKSELKPILGAKKQSGWITIRFTVNCNGEKGRYKLYQMDETYKNFSFNTQLIKQIFDAFMKLPNQWTIKNIHNMNVDAGYHLVFKIKNGKLVEVF